MLPLAHTVVLALHVLFAAAWFGMAASVPGFVRAARQGALEGGKVIGAMNGAVVLFYVFAVANWVLGRRLGYEVQYNHWAYHTSLTLGLILVGVQLALIWRGWKKLAAGDEGGRRTLSIGLGVGNLVWVTIFVLMYVGRGVIGGSGRSGGRGNETRATPQRAAARRRRSARATPRPSSRTRSASMREQPAASARRNAS